MKSNVVDARISPNGHLDMLSRLEVQKLLDTSRGELHELFRKCSLAVLNYGDYLDNGKELFERYRTFDIRVIQEERGIKLDVVGAPANSFVDGKIIKGVGEFLFSVLRDIIYVDDEINNNSAFNLESSNGLTNAVFCILRNAKVLRPSANPRLVVCWGGHSISRPEYEYTKEVGHELGLRDMDICTGCGPGAMKGPMKGAAIGHAKQRNYTGQYLGITEPGIVAAESPNPIVNDLVIMPDIEKRLEAFVRTGHAIIVFPGGVGTAEEILYLLSILLDPQNDEIPFPFIFCGPKDAESYFYRIDEFIGNTLGGEAQKKYDIIIDDPKEVAQRILRGIEDVKKFRKKHGDAFYFNWLLHIRREFQVPFEPTHENMRKLQLKKGREAHLLAGDMRRAFSGIVAGNVKESGIQAIEEKGLFELQGDRDIMEPLDALLKSFIDQGRMKLPSTKQYRPCYHIFNADSELKN